MSRPLIPTLWKKSHHLNELNASHEGQSVILMGWVNTRRDHGNLIFVDLRDRHGMTQVVFDPQQSNAPMEAGAELRNEFVLAIKGLVRRRPSGMVNNKLPTGEIEVVVTEAEILNRCLPLPFQISDTEIGESLRLKYRYLDLRRPKLRTNLMTRIKFVRAMREALEDEGFLDIETPFLYKSTPEGAREFLVPSRIHAGQFYALPQSPQLFKQVLMISGMERYYQVVKCFRDEDLRADRQPEFTQIDCEMSFCDQEMVMSTFERVITKALKKTKNWTPPTPAFPRMTFDYVMEHYGCDKPDIRFGLKLINLTEDVQNSGFQVFANAVSTGGIVNALCVKGVAEEFSRKVIDELQALISPYGAKGLAWAKVQAGHGTESWQSPIAKFFTGEQVDHLNQKCGAKAGDLLLFVADIHRVVKASLSALRNHLGARLNLYNREELAFLWVTDFPLLERDPDTGRLNACHHPFTSPLPQDADRLESDPENIRASAYDLVLNGNEVAGGSIRIHNPELQSRLFKVIGLSEEEAKAKFGFLLEALQFGAPPHGGMAYGLDRLVMILSGEDNLKDVIAFPKTNKGTCLMTESPSPVTPEQLRDLHIRVQSLGLENK